MYAIKNDEGKWLCGANGSHYWSRNGGDFFDQHDADTTAVVYGGHVVELGEVPAKVVVSEEEAKMLEEIQGYNTPCGEAILEYVRCVRTSDGKTPNVEQLNILEDRLMRAYVNGWTVKPKRYVLPMPDGTDDEEEMYYAHKVDDSWEQSMERYWPKEAVEYGFTVTQADIDAAPDWVKAITPVEMTDDEQ